MQFSPTRGCFSQMFKKQISKHSSKQIFWHQFCLWKTPSSRFFLFSPLCMPIFFKTFSSSGFWGVKKASCKRFHVFGENWQRNHFPKLTTLWLLLHPNVTNFAIVQCWNGPSYKLWHSLRMSFGNGRKECQMWKFNPSFNNISVKSKIWLWVEE